MKTLAPLALALALAAGLPARQDHDPFDIVAQLTDIARPLLGLERGNRVGRELAMRLARSQ